MAYATYQQLKGGSSNTKVSSKVSTYDSLRKSIPTETIDKIKLQMSEDDKKKKKALDYQNGLEEQKKYLEEFQKTQGGFAGTINRWLGRGTEMPTLANETPEYTQQKIESKPKTFGENAKGLASELIAPFVKTGLSTAELLRPSNILKNPIKGDVKAKDWEVNVLGKKVTSVQKNGELRDKAYKNGEITKEQLMGGALADMLDLASILPVGKAVSVTSNVYKSIGKKVLEKKLKEALIIPTITAGYGAGYGAAGGMEQNQNFGGVAKSTAIGTATGFGLGALLAGAGGIFGKLTAKRVVNKSIALMEKEVGKLTPEENAVIKEGIETGLSKDEILSGIKSSRKELENVFGKEEVPVEGGIDNTVKGVYNETVGDGTAIGAAPYRGVTVDNIEAMNQHFVSPEFKTFDKEINDIAKKHNIEIISQSNASGVWKDTDLNKIVYEPSKRIIIKDSTNANKFTAELGLQRGQQSMYKANFNAVNPLGVEYEIGFKDNKGAFEFLKTIEDSGIDGASLNGTSVFIGDVDKSLLNKVNNFYERAKQQGITTKFEGRKAEVRFVGQDEYRPILGLQTGERGGSGNTILAQGKEAIKPQGITPKVELKPAKAASDINTRLAKSGFNQLPEEELAGYTPITKNETIKKIAKTLEDYDKSIRMALGREKIPNGVERQPLFNAVVNRAVKEGDSELIDALAKSPIATERSLLAQKLGSAGYNIDKTSPINAIRDVIKTRTEAITKKIGKTRVATELKDITQKIERKVKKSIPTKEDYDKFISSITCT